MRRRSAALIPAVLAAAWLLSFLGPLLSPARALANRDIALFHLPLRATFRELAAFGLPTWNPWLHGGQPLLSNPSYAAFYPPSWLVFAAPPHYALSLMALLHGALAFAGAWRLARRLGCGTGAAALAGVGYAGCGAYVSLLSAFTLFCSMAWFPWVLLGGDAALQAPAGERWWRPALLAGGALALQLLNGEPVTVVLSGLGLLALAVPVAFRRPAAALRVVLPVAFAVALAAVQLLPTVGRLADSPRKGLPSWHATLWSLPPERLAEIVFPRVLGDPTRNLEGRYFGWRLEDRDYPYVESLYPGLLLAVLGLAALIRWRIPRRAAWALAFLAGIFLALGRHNPVFEALREAVPVLSVLRFPEKFAVLSVLALAFAGVLGWQRLLDERDEGRPETADFPLAIAGVALAAALVLAAVLIVAPRVPLWFVEAHGAPDLGAAGRAAALSYLRVESWAAAGTALAVAGLLALARWGRVSRRALEGLAVALLALDLWHYGHRLVRTLPASAYREPPPLAASLRGSQDRVFVQPAAPGAPETVPRGWGDPRTLITRTHLARLEPYSGLLWHVPYVFHTDFDLMLTGWGRTAQKVLDADWAQPQMAYRYLGVWNVGTLLLRAPAKVAAGSRDPQAALREVPNTYRLPRFRFVPRVSFHPSHPSALLAAHQLAWQVARHEQCVVPGRPAETVAFRREPRPLELADEGGRIALRYRAEEGAFFVAAMTYDDGWQASVDGRPVAACATAAGQVGVRLPAGEHQLVLRFRERLLGAGLAVTLCALGAGAAAFAFAPGRRRS